MIFIAYETENEQKGVPHHYFLIPYLYLLKRFGQTAHHQFCIINRKREENNMRVYTLDREKTQKCSISHIIFFSFSIYYAKLMMGSLPETF